MISVALTLENDEPKIVFWTKDYKEMDTWLQDNHDRYKFLKTVIIKEPEDAAKI